MARATPGHDEKRHRRDACATFSKELFMARATPGHDEQRHRRDACATFSKEELS
jgi:hypothetical protein